ncbi:FecR domain-containing protein [Teredinibacter sp. KSP-S5-2]|uniref:FecR domain-containing protein n=1 Tax=Teredinibacter sp. KSP-S5-2 TaxID=3034506 RepID=UPI0029345D53|nr:FecR domain-containing protein [Teredinibacter sp. KSP-S5-2]WNO08291.1 FecR domain-containing protein [Teredinibacter sp. KSP-S5-2]
MSYRTRLLLVLPFLLHAQFSLANDWVYTVRQGDTLWDLCLEYTLKKDCWLKIGPYNQVKYPKTLAPGTRIAFPADWLKNAPAKAEIIFALGDVQIAMEEASRAAQKGDLLGINSRIETGIESSTTIQFADGSVLTLEENSVLTLDLLSRYGNSGMVDTRLNLLQGAAKTRVPKKTPPTKLRISTPSAIAAVRGTDFRVISANNNGTPYTLSEVYDGAVGVGAEQNTNEVKVNKGFGLRADKDKEISQPLPLLPAPQLQPTPATQLLPIELQWEKVKGAEKYRIEVLQDAEYDMQVDSLFTEQKQVTISELANGCYRFRVSPYDQHGLQGLAQETKTCVANPIGSPVLSEDIKQDNNNLLISWSPVDNAKRYRIEISRNKSFNDIVATEETTSTEYSYFPETKKKLYFRVIAIGEYNTENTASNTVRWQGSRFEWRPLVGLSIVLWILVL